MSGAEQAGWTDDLPVSGRAASNLEAEYDDVEALIDAYRNAEDITDVSYVGSATMSDLREFIHDRDPDAERVRHENDDAVCTTFTTDHGLDDADIDSDEYYFAFVCPRCNSPNPLQGEPRGFKGKPFRCEGCGWVSLLEGNALDEFADEEGVC